MAVDLRKVAGHSAAVGTVLDVDTVVVHPDTAVVHIPAVAEDTLVVEGAPDAVAADSSAAVAGECEGTKDRADVGSPHIRLRGA